MQWLSENYKWLFDGVAGAAAIAVLGYLVQRIFKRSDSDTQQGTGTAELKHSSVEHSMIIGGSNNQVVIGHPSTTPKVVPLKTERPTPNFVYAGGQRKLVLISPSYKEGICDPRNEEERTNSVMAFVLKFENKVPGRGRKIGRALNVIAKMKFRHKNGATERDIDYGVWLNSPCNSTDIGIGDTRQLVLMCELDGRHVTFEDKRIDNRFLGSEGTAYIQAGDVEDYERVDITIIDQNSQASLHTKLRVWREGASICSSEL